MIKKGWTLVKECFSFLLLNQKRLKHENQGFVIRLDETALYLASNNRAVKSIRWNDITIVKAYKRDLFAYDLLCIFVGRNEANGLELNEDMRGWQGLVGNIQTYLPGVLKWEEWFLDVAFPAFEPNKKTIYRRCIPNETQRN